MALRENLAEWSKTPFESQQHMIEAMSSPEYRNPRNDAYRKAVEAKVCLGAHGIQTTVYEGIDRTNTDGGLGESNTTRGRELVDSHKTAEQMLAEIYGPLAVAPPKRTIVREDERSDFTSGRNGEQLSSVRIHPDF